MPRGGNYTRILKSALKEDEATYIQRLADLGEEAIRYAYKRKQYRNRTKNLRDSYASAVYQKGVLIESSIRFIGKQQAVKNDKYKGYGRDRAMEFLQNPPAYVKNADFYLLCVAAEPYARYLEEGSSYAQEKIQVISAASDYISARWRRTYTGLNLINGRHIRVVKGTKDPYYE